MIILYRILTYILLPFAAIFALLAVATFFFAFANPAMLLGVFLLVSFVIYFYCTFSFLHKGIINHQILTARLYDWIKVNAYVALPFAIINFMQSSTVIRNPTLIDESVKQMVQMQEQMGLPVQAGASYNSILLGVIYIMLFFSIILLVHIMLTFKLIHKYKSSFEAKEQAN